MRNFISIACTTESKNKFYLKKHFTFYIYSVLKSGFRPWLVQKANFLKRYIIPNIYLYISFTQRKQCLPGVDWHPRRCPYSVLKRVTRLQTSCLLLREKLTYTIPKFYLGNKRGKERIWVCYFSKNMGFFIIAMP